MEMGALHRAIEISAAISDLDCQIDAWERRERPLTPHRTGYADAQNDTIDRGAWLAYKKACILACERRRDELVAELKSL